MRTDKVMGVLVHALLVVAVSSVCVFASIIFGQSASAQVLPIAHYPLDTDASDVSGNNHNGLEEGSITYDDGITGGSALFDGASLIRISNFFPTTTDFPYSYSVWIKTTTEKLGAGVLTQWTSCGNPFGGASNDDDHFALTIYNHVPSDNLNLEVSRRLGSFLHAPRESVVDGAWHHVVISHDATGGGVMYVDGVAVATTQSTAAGTFVNAVDLVIGGYHSTENGCAPGDGFDVHFEGNIDDVRIYDSALSALDVEDLYNEVVDPVHPTPEEHAADLVDVVLGLNLPQNIENSYLAHLKKVSTFIEKGKTQPAINQLNAFVHKVAQDYQHGSITLTVHDALIALAAHLIADLSE